VARVRESHPQTPHGRGIAAVSRGFVELWRENQ